MIIDCHNHIGYDPAYLENRKTEDLIEEMEKTGIDSCLVFPFTTNPDVQQQNAIIKTALEYYPKRLIGFFTMNPKLPKMTDYMHEYKEQGFRGVVTDQRFGVQHGEKLFHELIECALVLDLPVWLHSDDKEAIFVPMGPLESMINKYPSVKFILSSMHLDAVYIASRHQNVFIDTAVYELGQDLLRAIRPLGTHRILMGSNTPYGTLKRELNKVTISDELSKFQKNLIFGQNIQRLLKL
jgi:predicted TIM-barrel fold metal-dependent hydrolase